jgi:hypothetical protein
MTVTSKFGRILSGSFLLLALTENVQALQITRTSSTNLMTDLGVSPQLQCSYASYQIYNNDAVSYSNLWVKIDSFTGTIVKLGGGDPGEYNLGSLAIGQTNTAFFYLQATNVTATVQTHTIKVYQGRPDVGTLLTNQNFSVTVVDTAKNNSSKVNVVVYGPVPPALGGLVTITIDGETGVIGKGDILNFTPASYTNWNAAAYQMVGCQIVLSNENAGTFSNILALPDTATPFNKNTPYEISYYFRAVGVTVAPTTVSPITYVSHGNQIVHTDTGAAGYGAFPPIQPATNTTVITNFASATQLYTNEILTVTVRFTNVGTNDVSVDGGVVDTLPSGFSYVVGSSRFNGSVVAGPIASGQILTWSESYNVPANSSRDFTFQATPVSAGYATNSVVAYSRSTQIDTTLATTDSAAATSTVRVLLQPTAVNDSGSTSEDNTLNVSGPGVLTNDSEPNGFAISVISYTQPTHGSVTVNASGSYSYIPAADYNGSDSFTYTLTNGNARASTATVNLTISSVNDVPTLNTISNLTLVENAGLQTVNLSGISAGATNESGQSLTITASSSNPTLIPNPTVNYTSPNAAGTLTFTPVASVSGLSTITVVVTDNGSTTNGGVNSVTNAFLVSVGAVNDPPSLNSLGDLTIGEDAGLQSVNLTGISAGPADEVGQSLTITANSSNPALIPNPTVNYTSPNATGTLNFVSATNASGQSTITVVIQDNGGTTNGGVNAVTNSFVVTVTAVNDPPTMSPLGNVTINEGAGLQTVTLTGISAGPADESGQTVSISAVSSNPALIPNPTVNYTNPSPTGTLTFTLSSNALGQSTITVVLQDNGAMTNGGVNALTNTFTITVLGVTNLWSQGGGFTVDVNDAAGLPGVGYTQTNFAGVLDIQSTSTNPFVIQLNSFNGGSPGLATNFNDDVTNVWTIATTTRGVVGFSEDKFAVVDTNFINDLQGGTFRVELSSDGSAVQVVFIPNHAPIASPASYGRAWGTSLRIPVADLLGNFTSDLDADGRGLLSLTIGTNGSWIVTNSTQIFFAPTNNFPESFSYIIRDLRAYRPGDTVRTATNWFSVSVTNATSSARSISSGGSAVTVRLAGVPGYAYDVERTTNVVTGPWIVLLTTNAPAGGIWRYVDNNPPSPAAYYRTRQH